MRHQVSMSLNIAVIVLLLATLVVGALATSGSHGTTETFLHHVTLDEHGDYVLHWNYNASHVTFEVHVKTRGYVGFGLSPNGKMYPADVVVGWVADDGKAYLKDYHTSGHFAPLEDASQDWLLLHGSESDAGTILKFVRKIDTCDPEDIAINDGTQRLVYSYHPADPQDGNHLMYHSATTRGTRSVSLLNQQLPPPLYDSDHSMKIIDIRPNNYVVPDKETTYLCVGFKMPDLGGKHHMVQWEPVYTPGNEKLLHHFVVQQCSSSHDDTIGHVHECFWDWPKEWHDCKEIVMAWATGGGAYYFPDDAGYAMGGPGDSGFYVMQIHYDNPQHLSGIVDNSGVRMRLTSSLRQHNVGSFVVSQEVTPLHVIPPGEQSFITKGYCDGKLLAKEMAAAGVTEITAISALQHAHLLAYGIKTRHFRNGTELEPIMDDPYYDFFFQEFRNFPKRIIKAGDDLRVECNYSTTARSELAFGGLTTRDEMCESIMYIYPKIDGSYCSSMTNWTHVYPEIYLRNITPAEVLKNNLNRDYDWSDPAQRKKFTELIENTPYFHIAASLSNGNNSVTAMSSHVERDDNYVPYVYPDKCTGTSTPLPAVGITTTSNPTVGKTTTSNPAVVKT